MTRTEAVKAAIAGQLTRRSALLDAATDLGEVTVVVRLLSGTTTIKSVVVSEQHVSRQSWRADDGGA